MNMKKVWLVLQYYDKQTGERDIRCRSDVDSQRGFKFLSDSMVRQTEFRKGTGNEREYYIAFQSESKQAAEHVANTLRLMYDLHKVERSILCQA